MKKLKGFTLIELIIGVMFVFLIGTIVINIAGGIMSKSSYSFGLNGALETRCMGGYLFTLDSAGHTRQILDEFGKAAKCN